MCAQLVGKTSAVLSLGDILLVTKIKNTRMRFGVMAICQLSQSKMLLKLCRDPSSW